LATRKIIMKKTTTISNFILIVALFITQLLGVSASAQKSTAVKKPVDNCDKLVLKSGQTLHVDITGIDSAKIYYVKCDSLEPVLSVLKNKVSTVKYADNATVYTNDETYGNSNSNSFGWTNYADQFKTEISAGKNVAASNIEQNDNSIPRSKLKKLFKTCPQALSEFNKSKTLDIAGAVVIAGGCTYLALSLKTVAKKRTDDYNSWWNDNLGISNPAAFDSHKWVVKKRTTAIIGMGITTVGLVIMGAAANHYSNSIIIYNAKHSGVSYIPVQYDLTLSSDGVGIGMRF